MNRFWPYAAFVIAFAVTGFLSYLVGAFYSVSFDIAEWEPITRRSICALQVVAGGFLSLMTALTEGSRS